MYRKLVAFHLTLILLAAIPSFAQEQWINTDRPDQTDGTYTIPTNTFQIENGVTLSKETIMNNFMLRYGAGKSTELRLGVDAGKEYGLKGLSL